MLQPGSGDERPKAADIVEVHYTGWTTDGEMFDSSVTRGEPAKFPLNRVIAGWTEGLQLMVQGEKRRLWIPEELAYKGLARRIKEIRNGDGKAKKYGAGAVKKLAKALGLSKSTINDYANVASSWPKNVF